ncbi:hypothetical protein [Nitrosomonas sp.]|uniref:hypothetical protein n=1 Tax=Nitrosomonas sp. TaxID=42353 RepID=UPI00284E3D77|nr:hypothetical protein [Nitrosomonas sp.]MDR4513930.1 hypothetical protein [Nitrosomonas sp.]
MTRTKYLGRDRFSYDVRGLILDKNRYWQWNMAQRLIEAASLVLLDVSEASLGRNSLAMGNCIHIEETNLGWLYMDGTLISIRNFSSYGELDEFVFVRFDEDNYANQVRFGGDRRVIMLTQLLSVFVVVGCLAVVNGVTS